MTHQRTSDNEFGVDIAFAVVFGGFLSFGDRRKLLLASLFKRAFQDPAFTPTQPFVAQELAKAESPCKIVSGSWQRDLWTRCTLAISSRKLPTNDCKMGLSVRSDASVASRVVFLWKVPMPWQRSPSRKRRQFSKASLTVEPWTCTVCSQEVTTKACSVCGLRKSYRVAAQHVKSEKVTPNHAIKPAPRIAGRPQVPPGTGAPEFYKKQLKALQTVCKNAIVLEDTALTASLEQGIAQTKLLSLDARPLSERLSALVQTKKKKHLRKLRLLRWCISPTSMPIQRAISRACAQGKDRPHVDGRERQVSPAPQSR